tara:strand:+ start:12372 stop:13850 length:1479 start_codon:yes stop_codon:yes gene_type:complete
MSVSKELKKGAFVNLFGVVGKMTAPIFLVVVNRLYGPDVFGIYITANIAIEIIIAFLTSGFKDGALIFVSRFADDKEDQNELYTALSNAFAWSIGLSIIVLLLALTFGNTLLEIVYKEEFSTDLIIMAGIMIFSIPLMAFERIVLAATQGLKIMKYDAISNGWIRPLVLLVFSILFWLIEPSVTGMAFAYFATQALLFLVSIYIYNRELSWKKLLYGFKTFRLNSELIEFAIPQSINMTLNRFLTGIDVLMLPAFGFSSTVVGFYGAGSILVREIRSVKMIFSTAFAPFIVRLHKKSLYEELSHHFSKTSAWVTTIAIPIILLMAIFKDVLLAFIHPEYGGDSTFMYFLLPIPYLFCSFSLAGNVVAMTGHSKLNLMNSVIVATTNTVLNLILIPKFGIIGAAVASAIAMLILNTFEVIEAQIVASTRLYLRDIVRPHLSGMFAAGVLALSLIYVPWFSGSILAQLALAALIVSIYGLGIGSELFRKVRSKI